MVSIVAAHDRVSSLFQLQITNVSCNGQYFIIVAFYPVFTPLSASFNDQFIVDTITID